MSYVYGQTAPKILANLEALRVSRPRLFLDLCSFGLFSYIASSLFFFFFFSSLFLYFYPTDGPLSREGGR